MSSEGDTRTTHTFRVLKTLNNFFLSVSFVGKNVFSVIKLSHRCALSFSLSFEREKRRERSVKSGSFYLLLSLFFLFALDSFSSVNTERESI